MQVDTPNTVADDTATTSTTAANTDSTTATDADGGKGQGDVEGESTTTEATGDAAGEAGEEETPTGAPEQYEDFTLPDGFELVGERLEMAHEFAKTNNWTQEQAQSGVETYLKFREAEKVHERGLWGAQSEQEYGAGFKDIADGAQRALVDAEKQRPGITARLDATNLGNHPDVLWAFNQLGVLAKAQPMHGMGNEASTEAEMSSGDRMYQYADKPTPRAK